MVAEIVRQAVQIKLGSRSESPLISPAEYLYAAFLGLKELEAPEECWRALRESSDTLSLREKLTPYFSRNQENYREDAQKYRLFHLLTHCRTEGEITEEVRAVLPPGE